MELVDIDIEALTSRVLARVGPTDLAPELQKAGVRIGMAVALETMIPTASASQRPAMEAAILDNLRDAMATVLPAIGHKFVPSASSDVEELANDVIRMARVAARHEAGSLGEQEIEELEDILRELDNTKLWRLLICVETPCGSLIHQACEILSDSCIRSLDGCCQALQPTVADDAAGTPPSLQTKGASQ